MLDDNAQVRNKSVRGYADLLTMLYAFAASALVHVSIVLHIVMLYLPNGLGDAGS